MTAIRRSVPYAPFTFKVYGLDDEYPPVPLPMGAAENVSPPAVAGVYFLWGDSFGGGRCVVYVGQAVSLERRVRLGAHHALREWHDVSYLLTTKDLMPYAEAYYIAMLRPSLNKANFFQPTKRPAFAAQAAA